MRQSVADQVKEMRVALGHTQHSLSVQIGIHEMTISKWERGLARPHPVFISALRRLYEASMGQAA